MICAVVFEIQSFFSELLVCKQILVIVVVFGKIHFFNEDIIFICSLVVVFKYCITKLRHFLGFGLQDDLGRCWREWALRLVLAACSSWEILGVSWFLASLLFLWRGVSDSSMKVLALQVYNFHLQVEALYHTSSVWIASFRFPLLLSLPNRSKLIRFALCRCSCVWTCIPHGLIFLLCQGTLEFESELFTVECEWNSACSYRIDDIVWAWAHITDCVLLSKRLFCIFGRLTTVGFRLGQANHKVENYLNKGGVLENVQHLFQVLECGSRYQNRFRKQSFLQDVD